MFTSCHATRGRKGSVLGLARMLEAFIISFFPVFLLHNRGGGGGRSKAEASPRLSQVSMEELWDNYFSIIFSAPPLMHHGKVSGRVHKDDGASCVFLPHYLSVLNRGERGGKCRGVRQDKNHEWLLFLSLFSLKNWGKKWLMWSTRMMERCSIFCTVHLNSGGKERQGLHGCKSMTANKQQHTICFYIFLREHITLKKKECLIQVYGSYATTSFPLLSFPSRPQEEGEVDDKGGDN